MLMTPHANEEHHGKVSSTQPLTPQAKLASLIERFTSHEGPNTTPIAPLHLFRYATPQKLLHSVFKPVVCLVAQGSKRVTLGGAAYVYDPTHFLLITVDLPVASQVIEATPYAPYLSLSLDIDAGQIGALMAEMNGSPSSSNSASQQGLSRRNLSKRNSSKRGILIGHPDAPLLDAFVRLLRLLEQPQHIGVLAPLILREIFYLLLVSEHGDSLHHAALGQSEPGIVQALHWLKHHFAEPLRIENIAREVHMSPSAFHHGFKAVTAMTPLQYQKQLRLQEARRLLLEDEMDAARAAFTVGYESASQFNREYHRLFGDSPRRDIARLRGIRQRSGSGPAPRRRAEAL